MADALIAALTTTTDQPPVTPATAINVVMTDRSLFGTADDPALVDGYGMVDADLGRELAHGERVWLRRLFADPETGELVATDSRARCFPAGLRRLVRLRDQHCRTPWCCAPIRHTDHADPAEAGGPTSLANGQGLCEACNQAKQTTGWTARPRPGPRHTVDITTPTGQTHRSRPPAPPGFERPGSVAERLARDLLLVV
jgi:5-methylcytosine-specific restriction endonuclease McrA